MLIKKFCKVKTGAVIALLLLCTFSPLKGQEFGLSFSYFFPKNGYFSNPVSPLSLRGIGVNFNRFVGIETGFTLYRMSGMNVTDLPFESKDPIMGPFFSFMVPLDLVLSIGDDRQTFSIKGGGFTFFNFDNRINYGNLDRALVEDTGLEVVNADLDYDNKLGLGVRFGAEYTFYFTKKFGLTLEGYYLIGSSDLNLRGEYSGSSSSTPFETVQVDFPESKLDFTGLEISIGVVFGNR